MFMNVMVKILGVYLARPFLIKEIMML